MNPFDLLNYVQLGIFVLGVLSILIAGVQDKKSRLAPAIYLSPTLIGFGLNPVLGLIGLVGTFVGIIFWKDEWNESVGLADALLFFTILMCLTNLTTLWLVIVVMVGVLGELILSKQVKQPLVWITAKWITITLILLVLTLLLR